MQYLCIAFVIRCQVGQNGTDIYSNNKKKLACVIHRLSVLAIAVRIGSTADTFKITWLFSAYSVSELNSQTKTQRFNAVNARSLDT